MPASLLVCHYVQVTSFIIMDILSILFTYLIKKERFDMSVCLHILMLLMSGLLEGFCRNLDEHQPILSHLFYIVQFCTLYNQNMEATEPLRCHTTEFWTLELYMVIMCKSYTHTHTFGDFLLCIMWNIAYDAKSVISFPFGATRNVTFSVKAIINRNTHFSRLTLQNS
jgi:hypothetical protein